MKSGALFAGIGGFCLGFQSSGFQTCWANEIDPVTCSTFRHNFPHIRLVEKDVRELTVKAHDLEPVDVLHAGFPCQSFSQAGARTGFSDDRGMLFFEIIRIIKEFEDKKPAVLVLENAPFLKYGEGGMWLNTVISEIQRAGYWFRPANVQELDLTTYTGLPQKRPRLYMTAFSVDHFRDGRFSVPVPSSTPIQKKATDLIDFKGSQSSEYYIHEENRYFNMLRNLYRDTEDTKYIYQLRKYFVRTAPPGVCPTLTANMGWGGHNVPFIWDSKGLRKLTERECLRLQGFPDTYEFPAGISMRRRYSQVGNAVSPPMATLLAKGVADRLVHQVKEPIYA
jgi:DNA (cytosine-5)-methyltransferase 1